MEDTHVLYDILVLIWMKPSKQVEAALCSFVFGLNWSFQQGLEQKFLLPFYFSSSLSMIFFFRNFSPVYFYLSFSNFEASGKVHLNGRDEV